MTVFILWLFLANISWNRFIFKWILCENSREGSGQCHDDIGFFNGSLGGPLSKALPGMKGQGVEPPPPIPRYLVSRFCLIFGGKNFHKSIICPKIFLVIPLSNPHSLKTAELPLRSTMLKLRDWVLTWLTEQMVNESKTLLNILKYV